jgi:hypothetical protein
VSNDNPIPPERWLPVPGYDGRYYVSDRGEVRSHVRKATRLLAQTSRSQAGYRGVSLGIRNPRYVHVLVLEAFVGPRPHGAVVRHLNGDNQDNRLENLAWGTALENARDRVNHGRDFSASKTHCKNGHPFSGDNLRVRGRHRFCRACARDNTRRSRQRQAQESAA